MNYAPESGSLETLKRIKKKVKLENLMDSLDAVVSRGLNVKINMIFAFPGDTPGDMWQSFKFGVKCAWHGAHDSSFIPYVPYPGSELYNQLKEQGEIHEMSDEYFNSLIPFSDLEHAKSYNRYVTDRQLVWLRLAYFSLFYGTMFLRRPNRFFRMFVNSSEKQVSRGEEIIRTFFRRRKMLEKGPA